MRAHFGLPSVKSETEMDKRAPITVKFEIPYFTVSGIQVRYLKIVEKSGYQALPWVRYITQNGDDYRCVVLTFLAGKGADDRLIVCGQHRKREQQGSTRSKAGPLHVPEHHTRSVTIQHLPNVTLSHGTKQKILFPH